MATINKKLTNIDMKKQFVFNCINPEIDITDLAQIVEEAEEITDKEFLQECEVESDILRAFRKYPNDYSFLKFVRSKMLPKFYFFRHSAIEYFYS